MSADQLVAAPALIVDREQAEACRAGLWLFHDFLDEAHAIVQAIHQPEASYWHAIVHRREGDYSNAKYWNHRAGELPIFAALADHVRSIDSTATASVADRVTDSAGRWRPDGWVDVYRDACHGRAPFSNSKLLDWARNLQQIEWRLLIAHCWRLAVANGGDG